MRRFPDLRSLAVSGSLALVILALVAPFVTAQWVAFEEGRADAAPWTRFSADLRTATYAILKDLVIGRPTFDVSIAGAPLVTAAERSHMRDVRAVVTGFYSAAGLALAILMVGLLGARRSRAWTRAPYLRAVRIGAGGG